MGNNLFYMYPSNNGMTQQQPPVQTMPTYYVVNNQSGNMNQTPIQYMQPVVYLGPNGTIQQGFLPTANCQGAQNPHFQPNNNN